MDAHARVLLVEDEEIVAIIIRDLLEGQGFDLTWRADGQAAWEHLLAEPGAFDLILLDRGLPKLDGMEVLRRMKADPRLADIPVVLETGLGDHQAVREGLAQGAYYYLVKPFQPEVLLAVTQAALRQKRELQAMQESVRSAERPLALLQTGLFHFRDLEEGRLLANYLARACPDPERTILGLQELLTNAVEHGNLAISYAEKGVLLLDDAWEAEVRRRLSLPEYRDRYVAVDFRRSGDGLHFVISDQGEGFDWAKYLEFSTERAFDIHGRGIAMASQVSFDALEYQGRGNRVAAMVRLDALPVETAG